MMVKNCSKSILLNIIFPIALGAIIYYLISPDVIFVKKIDDYLGIGFHFSGINTNNLMLRFTRNYFMDMLWGYALVFALFWVIGNNTADLMKTFLIAFSFSVIMEILQVTPIAKGTFDVWDIVVEFIVEVVAVFIIKNLLLRRNFK